MSADSTRTDELLARVASGDQSALNQLLDGQRAYLSRLIEVRMEPSLRQRVDPSDVIQETMIVASRRMDDFLLRRPTSFRLWIRRKALERLVDLRREHRAQKRDVQRDMAMLSASSQAIAKDLVSGGASQRLRRKELVEQVGQALLKLSESDREILVLRHAENLANSEVAELLGIKSEAASKRYGRAVRRLSAELAEMGFSQS